MAGGRRLGGRPAAVQAIGLLDDCGEGENWVAARGGGRKEE